MSFSDPTSLAELHDSVSGADDGFLSGVGNALTKGVPLALGSGITSLLNTGVSLGNAFGADLEKIDFGAEVASFDDDLAKYYQQHQGGVDLGGFLATSILPGVAGIKALKMAQGGIAGTNAAAEIGLIKNTRGALGYFRSKEEYFVGKSLERIRAASNEVFSAVDNQKLLAIAAGAADQALQGAAFQTAVLLTMNQSPVLSKEDEGYFTSLLHNSSEIWTAGLVQGVVGGAIGGFGIAGKLKKLNLEEDLRQFPSRHYTKVGVSDVLGLDPGTGIAADFSFWTKRGEEFEAGKKAGTLTDVEIRRYEKTHLNQENDIRLRITEKLTDKDGELSEALWKSITASADPQEATSLIFSAARQVKRIGLELQPDEEGAVRVFTSDGPLVARKAENILKRIEKRPEVLADGVFDNPTTEQLIELHALKKELYKDSSGVFHVLEDSDYAKKTLPRGFKAKNFSLIVKLLGDNAGRVTETAYPVAGDLGKVSFAKGRLLIDGAEMKLPEAFDPIANNPVDSSMQFLHAKLANLPEAAESVVVPRTTFSPEAEAAAKTSLTEQARQLVSQGRLSADEVAAVLNAKHTTPRHMAVEMQKLFDTKLAPGFGVQIDFAGLEAANELRPRTEGTFENMLSVSKGNLPLLESLVARKLPKEITSVLYDGEEVGTNLLETLRNAKLEARTAAMNEKHGFDRIARELNVTQDFAETGQGEGFLLKEDHSKPIHAAIDYETKRLPDGFHVQGIEKLRERVEMGYALNQSTAADILRDFYTQLPKTAGTLLNISTVERFNSLLTSASPDYGGFGMVATQSGKVANAAKQARREETLGSVNGYNFQVQASAEAKLEMNQYLNKIRSAKEAYFVRPVKGEKPTWIPESIFKMIGKEGFDEALQEALEKKIAFQMQTPEAEALALKTQEIAARRAQEWNKLHAAQGSGRFYDPEKVYIPPINTRKFAYVGFVKEKADLGTGSRQEAGVISAHTRENFEEKLNTFRAAHGENFDVYTPSDIAMYKKIQAEYEDTAFLGDSMADSALRKEGLLYEAQPRTDDQFITEMNEWHFKQEGHIVNQAIELHYAQEFAELRAMGKDYESLSVDKFGKHDRRASAAENPYLRYIHTALDVSDFDRYNSLWGKFNDVTEGIAKKMFSAWDTWRDKASAGEVDWTTANKMAESYGFTAPYKGVVESIINPKVENPRNVQGMVAKANGAVSTLTLGLDFLNSVVNVVSLPIMAMSEMKYVLSHISDPKIVGELKELTSVTIPGTEHSMPTPMKLLHGAIKNMVQEGKERGAYYEQIGAIKTNSQLYASVTEASQLTKEATASPEGFKSWTENLHEKAQALADAGKTVTGYNKAEWVVRFLASDMMRQITDKAGIAASDAPAYINAFVNRVHGNYLASQRPHLFQGMVGQAISLFQTYQFNIMQNMVRFVEAGDKTAAATLLGLQNTIFGLQGNPAFGLLNAAIGNANAEHTDVVSGAQKILGKDVSDWLLYGLGSNAIGASLYNRGDLTPRYITVVPHKIEDIPAISIPAKAIGSFITAASNIVKGGNVAESLLDGVAHFGANRPIAGLAQVVQGYRTTGKGDLMTAYNDMNGFAIAAKLAGGEELNRAIAVDAYYRNLAYKKKDEDMRNSLGEAVKTTMYKGQNPTQEQVVGFMDEYTRAGGNPQGFNRFLMSNFKHANQSQMNEMAQHVNSRAGRLQAQAMGGDLTPDTFTAAQTAPE